MQIINVKERWDSLYHATYAGECIGIFASTLSGARVLALRHFNIVNIDQHNNLRVKEEKTLGPV